MPWWMMARMRRRIFLWLAVALGGGMVIGWRLTEQPRWWWIAIGLFLLSLVSGAIAFRLTRPLIMVVKAARELGDGKLDTRLDVHRHGGEMRVLASAINDMAEKIEQQMADQKQLLAAVSHELRTPLGHMRVLVETARSATAAAATLPATVNDAGVSMRSTPATADVPAVATAGTASTPTTTSMSSETAPRTLETAPTGTEATATSAVAASSETARSATPMDATSSESAPTTATSAVATSSETAPTSRQTPPSRETLPTGETVSRTDKALAEIEREILVLDDLVGKLLASSRLEFGSLDRRPIDLGELVSDAATTAGVDPEAIEAIGSVRAAVDPTLIRRAVANLLDNARVHGRGAIAVRIERRAGQIAVEVDDAGPGVARDRRAEAFRAFGPSTGGGGLGLGLALVSRIAVAHGGGAWIEDRPGGGARIGFSIQV
jgi:signal transduction histidine kinase